MAGGSELLEPLAADVAHRLHGGLEVLARVELARVLGEDLRMAPVMAIRLSVSMLIFRTPFLMPRWISSTGTPQVWGISPPYWLMMS